MSYPKDIQLFFNEIVVLINEVLDADFILIAGSFGKESWLYFNDELVSDFEFVFVCKKLWSIKKKAQLLKKMNSMYPFEINLKGFLLNKVESKVISNYASKNPGYISLDFFDTFSNPIFLYKKNSEILNIDISVKEVPSWEAWRLYVNRMADLLKLKCNPHYDEKTRNYYWLKIFESTAEAYCITKNIYHKNISKRLELFDNELIKNDDELDLKCKESVSIIRQALLARKNHDLSFFKINLSIEERSNIINSWMKYFEAKVLSEENMLFEDNSFFKSYLKNNKIQKKYLEGNSLFIIPKSNFIRLLFNYKGLINANFKFYNLIASWRHLILLSISSLFKDSVYNKNRPLESIKIFGKIMNKKYINSLSKEKYIKTTIDYWKFLR